MSYYLNNQKVMDEANKIFEVMKKAEELNPEEKIASVMIANSMIETYNYYKRYTF